MNYEAIEARISLLEDIQAIETLQKTYGYFFDLKMWPEVIALFSEHAESAEITDHGVFKGMEGIKRLYWDFIGKKGVPYPPWVMFMVMQAGGVITVSPDGTHAMGRWQTPLFEARPFGGRQRQMWSHGYYENEYVKEKGEWLLSKLHWNLTLWTPYESGWLKVPKLAETPFPDADAPPTAYHPYPSGFCLPFHYPHPVSEKLPA